jgi:hypothetical protein
MVTITDTNQEEMETSQEITEANHEKTEAKADTITDAIQERMESVIRAGQGQIRAKRKASQNEMKATVREDQ